MITPTKRRRETEDHEAGSPSARQARAFKWARTHGPSEQWRQRLLRTCLQRMKESRAANVCERRKERMRIVEEETKRLHPTTTGAHTGTATGHNPYLNKPEIEMSVEDDQEELLAVLEDLDQSLQTERLEQQREADDAVRDMLEQLIREVDDDVAHLVDLHESSGMGQSHQDDFVLCPVCNRSGLVLHNGTLRCACGIQIDCGTEGNVTPAMVRDRLGEVLAQHQAHCTGRLGFGVKQTFGSFLWAVCATCKFECVAL